jgi:membrane-bound ClpP family serine protease
MVEEAAEIVDKVAEDVGKSIPEDSSLKKFVKTVENIAEEVDKDAEVLESFVEKV